MTRPKVPRTAPADLVHEPGDILSVRPQLWRIHRTRGTHVLAWNQQRGFGPLPTMRYDPQPEPTGPSSEGVMYTATSLATALAETFQATRVVDSRSFGPQVTAWTPTRDLHLLDLTGNWALRNGAAFALATAPKSTCRAWARQIRATWPDLDGMMTAAAGVACRNQAGRGRSGCLSIRPRPLAFARSFLFSQWVFGSRRWWQK